MAASRVCSYRSSPPGVIPAAAVAIGLDQACCAPAPTTVPVSNISRLFSPCVSPCISPEGMDPNSLKRSGTATVGHPGGPFLDSLGAGKSGLSAGRTSGTGTPVGSVTSALPPGTCLPGDSGCAEGSEGKKFGGYIGKPNF